MQNVMTAFLFILHEIKMPPFSYSLQLNWTTKKGK